MSSEIFSLSKLITVDILTKHITIQDLLLKTMFTSNGRQIAIALRRRAAALALALAPLIQLGRRRKRWTAMSGKDYGDRPRLIALELDHESRDSELELELLSICSCARGRGGGQGP
ncbi:hypothetical protein QYE76_001725 [Lolium multiflorum]|uniref:Uncharacterized protein n=1 Tax=Lolium multiflorum TaxID=4521 RepID=A0AAD8RL81_LOLMU|nr:hypothetical protein QYE76_001725 [Lolium multiflorum]